MDHRPRGEPASARVCVNRTSALWSTWMVSTLVLAGPGLVRPINEIAGSERGLSASVGHGVALNLAAFEVPLDAVAAAAADRLGF